MKRFLLHLSLVFVLFSNAQEIQALPNCPVDINEYRDNCFGAYSLAIGEYVSEFKNNMFHEQGTLTYANGTRYVGDWKRNNFHGRGTLTFANGDKYVGEWKDSQISGQGIRNYANGDKYVGS